jgi:hypothetical protein
MIRGSTGLSAAAYPAAGRANTPGSGSDISRRRRRHREMLAFSAVRTTHAAGAGCLLTDRHDAQARAKASSTSSCATSRSLTLTRTENGHASLDWR